MSYPKSKTILSSFLIALCILLTFPQPASASGFVVNTFDDIDDGHCNPGHCSLREAINAANANPGPDTIEFDVPDGGSNIIRLNSPLPALTDDATTIDATTLSYYAGYPEVFLGKDTEIVETCLLIESNDNVIRGLGFAGFGTYPGQPQNLDGAIVIKGDGNIIEDNVIGLGASGNSNGIHLFGSDNIVRNNVFSNNDLAGITAFQPNNTIQGNLIGTDETGTSAIPNGTGILLLNNSDYTLVGGAGAGEGNLVSGNQDGGIRCYSGHNELYGNLIGVDINGSAALQNGDAGISIHASNNQIGGGSSGQGNVISGNDIYGITVDEPNNVIQGNIIGLDVSGTAPIPNEVGIHLQHDAHQTLIGGAGTGEGNLISGNQLDGIDCDSNENEFYGNTIGLDISGSAALPNDYGIIISSSNNHVGGGSAGQGNVISGNVASAIWVYGDLNFIQGNHIGTDITGSAIIPNNTGIAIASSDNIIGGLTPNLGNTIIGNSRDGITLNYIVSGYSVRDNFLAFNIIAENGRAGVLLGNGTNANTITQNSIYDNDDLGIVSFGANSGIQPPVLSANPLSTTISGTACANCLLEFFLAEPDPSGFGEGRTYLDLGYADSNGDFSVPVDGIGFCQQITATATDTTDWNTSEFSQNVYANCIQIQPLYLYPSWVFTIVVFGVLAWIVRRRRPDSRRAVLIGAAAGGLLFLILIFALPFIRPEFKAIPQCGNGVVEGGETCDGDDLTQCLSGQICKNCRCTTVVEMPVCGDGVVDEGEQCDGDDLTLCLSGQICENCRCTTIMESSFCGDGDVDEGEQCDGDDLTQCLSGQVCENCRCVTLMEAEPPSEGCFYTALSNTNCRQSDYRESDPVAIVMEGESALLVGLNPDYTHGLFELESGAQCWMWFNTLEGPENPLGTCGVQLVNPPEPPVELACRSDLDESGCLAAGGEYIVGVGCSCP